MLLKLLLAVRYAALLLPLDYLARLSACLPPFALELRVPDLGMQRLAGLRVLKFHHGGRAQMEGWEVCEALNACLEEAELWGVVLLSLRVVECRQLVLVHRRISR